MADFQRVTKVNADELLRLMRELYAHEVISWREVETRAAVEVLLDNDQQGCAWFIAVNTEIVGYMVLTLAFSLEFGGKFVLIDELYIREQATGKGIGRAAVAFAEQRARAMGAHAVRLEAGHDNERALRFYERSGFRREARYLMTKRLD